MICQIIRVPALLLIIKCSRKWIGIYDENKI